MVFISKIEGQLPVHPVGIRCAAHWIERIPDVIADEETAESRLRRGVRFYLVSDRQIQFGADKASRVWTDAVTTRGAWRAVDLIKTVLRVGEPEGVIIQRQRQLRGRLDRRSK